MGESAAELEQLQKLLDTSHNRSGPHLQSIIVAGSRTPTARQIVAELTGMKVLVLTTVSRAGRPRSSAVDGHFLGGRWVFTTSGDAVKARDIRQRPAVSAVYVDGERFAVFVHGDAEIIDSEHPARAAIEAHLTEHYGVSPSTWGPSIVYGRIVPRFMIAYAPEAQSLPDVGSLPAV